MRYESMVIVDPVTAKSDLEKTEASIKSLIEKCGGSNLDVEHYGERKLAYKIGKYKRGFYFLLHFDMEGTNVPNLLREYKLSEDIFRYVVFQDEDAEFERRDLARPVTFNIDSLGKSKFDRAGENPRGPRREYERPVTVSAGNSDGERES